VDSDRKNELAGDIQLFDEDCALDVARGEIVVIIEADFAISDNFGMGAESAQFGIGFGRGFGGFVRMDADGRDDLWVTVGEANGAIEMWRAIAGADAKNAVDAGLGGADEDGVEIGGEFLVVEMSVGIGDGHGRLWGRRFRLPLLRCRRYFRRAPTGTSSRNPASTGFPPSREAATIMPLDSMPRSFRGFRLATITTLRPIIFSGS